MSAGDIALRTPKAALRQQAHRVCSGGSFNGREPWPSSESSVSHVTMRAVEKTGSILDFDDRTSRCMLDLRGVDDERLANTAPQGFPALNKRTAVADPQLGGSVFGKRTMKSKPTAIFVPPLKSSGSKSGTTVRITSRQMEGAYCVCEMTMMPGDGVSRHVHDRDEEFYYILEGAYEFQAGDERFSGETGSIIVIPRDVPHQFRNVGEAPARALMIFRPGGFDELGEEMRQVAAAGTLDEKQRQAIFNKWGIHFDKDSRL